ALCVKNSIDEYSVRFDSAKKYAELDNVKYKLLENTFPYRKDKDIAWDIHSLFFKYTQWNNTGDELIVSDVMSLTIIMRLLKGRKRNVIPANVTIVDDMIYEYVNNMDEDDY